VLLEGSRLPSFKLLPSLYLSVKALAANRGLVPTPSRRRSTTIAKGYAPEQVKRLLILLFHYFLIY